MHLGAVRPIESILGEPRRVMLGDYDSFSLVSVSVDIEFDQGWVRCIVLNGSPSTCRERVSIYLEGLPCLLQSEGLTGEGCTVEISSAARGWLTGRWNEIGDNQQVSIVARWGAVVLVDVRGQGAASFECRFRGAQPVVLECCTGLGPVALPGTGATPNPYDQLQVIRPGCDLAAMRGELPGGAAAEAECFSPDPESRGCGDATPTASPTP
ncbi:MAG: hypothetical protein AB1449_00300 [Chloroflexota bacterium]